LKNKKISYSDQQQICQAFAIPDIASDLVDYFFSKEDQAFLLQVGRKTFSAYSFDPLYIKNAYQRGIISKADEQGLEYRLSYFYEMLDVFVCTCKAKYDELSAEKKIALDAWYFHTYCDSLDPDLQRRPTSDKVLPLIEILQLIEIDHRTPYLNYCDCRSLTGTCNLPLRTCITYRTCINSFADRGISEKIDKDRVKQIMIDADKAGLMHTINDNGICNCCGDCCYLFRAQKQRKYEVGFWPESKYIVEIDEQKCVACGRCVRRCHLHVFELIEKHIICITSSCTGCGLCINTCPSGALKLVAR